MNINLIEMMMIWLMTMITFIGGQVIAKALMKGGK